MRKAKQTALHIEITNLEMDKLSELKYNLNYIMIGIHKISECIKQDKSKLDDIQKSIIQLFEIVNLYENKDMVSVNDLNLVIDDA